MHTINPVFDIFVPSGVYATLGTAYADYISNSANDKQLAVFSAADNTSLDSTATDKAKQGFFLAMPVFENGELKYVHTTKGIIYPDKVSDLNSKCSTAWQQQIYMLSGYTLDFDSDYVIKFILSNKWLFQDYNTAGKVKTYTYHTEQQVGTATTPDYGKFAVSIRNQVNSDNDGLITCKAFYYDSVNTVYVELVSDSDITNWADSNPGQPVILKFYINRMPLSEKVEYNYLPQREIPAQMFAYGPGMDKDNITEEQELKYEEVSGAAIKGLEFEQGGWEGNPEFYRYRQDNFFGYKDWEYFADPTSTYSLLTVAYLIEYPQTVQIENKQQLVAYIASNDVTVYNSAKNLIATLAGVTVPADCA